MWLRSLLFVRFERRFSGSRLVHAALCLLWIFLIALINLGLFPVMAVDFERALLEAEVVFHDVSFNLEGYQG